MSTMSTPTDDEEAAAIWSPVVGLKTGETVTLPGSLPFAWAHKAADIEADKLAAQGKAVDWTGTRRIHQGCAGR